MLQRDKGYTFLGRYDILDRATYRYGHDWFITDVFQHFGPSLSQVISIGCSVGINEVILAINNPQVNFTAIDIDTEAIEKAKSGLWNLDDIRPSGLCIPSDDETLRKLYNAFCPENYFDIDFQKGILKLLKPVENILFETIDARNTAYTDNYFDLVIMHMVASKDCYPYHEEYVRLGNEVERIIRQNGLFWNQSGLFQVNPKGNLSPYYRVLNLKSFYAVNRKPISRELLFPPPE